VFLAAASSRPGRKRRPADRRRSGDGISAPTIAGSVPAATCAEGTPAAEGQRMSRKCRGQDPRPIVDVEYIRGARGIGEVRGMHPSAGEPRAISQESMVTRRQRSPNSAARAGRAPVQEPLELRSQKIGVQQQPGPSRKHRLQTFGLEFFPIWPTERRHCHTYPRCGGAAFSVPDHRGFPLVVCPWRMRSGAEVGGGQCWRMTPRVVCQSPPDRARPHPAG